MLQDFVHFAGVNFANHFMISGLSEPLKKAEQILKSLGITYQPLQLNYAFHSLGIANAKESFESYLKSVVGLNEKSTIPFFSGVKGKELKEFPDNYFWDVIYEPISFRQTVVEVLEKAEGNVYVDLGPSGTLATFVNYNLASKTSTSRVFPLLTPFHNGEKNLALLQKVCKTSGEFHVPTWTIHLGQEMQ